jgi:hypothetical protein
VVDVQRIVELAVGEMYAGYAGLVYWRLRTRSEFQTEIAETRAWVRSTPPWHLCAWLLPALPLIAEATCLVNGLLWPVELATWPWRRRRRGRRGERP